MPDVSGVNRATLRQMLVSDYASLNRRLARYLGSSDTAADALHDTYLKLDGVGDLGIIRRPQDYILRIAVNIARDRRRREARLLSITEVRAFFELPDDAPDTARIVEARSDLSSLTRALAELPERRRLIFKAVLIGHVPRQELAKRFGITQRTVDLEVKRALEFGARHLRNLQDGFDYDPSESSGS